MAEVQSHPAQNSEPKVQSHEGDKDALINRLDELLEKYLHTLDEYQKTRDQLSKQLSSGYLSLAQANFQNRSTAHYGQDNYDERMQAIRKATVQEETDGRLSFSITSKNKDEAAISSEKPEDENQEDAEDAKESKTMAKPIDPLRWFGILVPPALRSAQSSFVSVVEGPIPQLANVARELRSQEIEIGRVRKQIKKL